MASFTTFPTGERAANQLSFLLGSCRYPGLLWKRKHSDRIFGPMLKNAQDGAGARFALMVGDQIYADMLNRAIPIGLADTYDEFQERYDSAFGSRNMRRLLRQLPTYMILDDHEIEDNWAQDRIRDRKKRMLFNVAIGAYCSYQWTHSPRNFGMRLYYSFECAGYPFFVLDGRTQRFKEDRANFLKDNNLLGRPSAPGEDPSQLEELCRWLRTQQRDHGDVPKFIVSASVFVPNNVRTTRGDDEKNDDDGWAAFPTTRRELLDCIVSAEIQNVVFLSGDIHCSNVATLRFGGSEAAEKLKTFSVTSSAFYWPFPFSDGDPSSYVHDSKDTRTPDTFDLSNGITMDYTATSFTQEDNFCRLEIDRRKGHLTVHAIGSDGKPVRRRNRRALTTALDLAQW